MNSKLNPILVLENAEGHISLLLSKLTEFLKPKTVRLETDVEKNCRR